MRVVTSGDRPIGPPPVTTEADRVRDRLTNFGNWSRDPSGLGRCGSAERHYRPERLLGDTEDDRRRARVPIDVQDARVVWRALMPGGPIPPSHVRVLQACYVHRLRGESLRGWLRQRGVDVRGRDLAALERAAFASAVRVLR